jgi:hypothetical protein
VTTAEILDSARKLRADEQLFLSVRCEPMRLALSLLQIPTAGRNTGVTAWPSGKSACTLPGQAIFYF